MPFGQRPMLHTLQRSVLRSQTSACGLQEVFPCVNAAGSQHDERRSIGGQVAVLSDTASRKQGEFVLFADFDEVQVRVTDIAGDGMPHMVHRYVVGRARSAVFAVDG